MNHTRTSLGEHTISDQHYSAMMPSLKELVLQIHLRDHVLGRRIDQVAHGAIGSYKVTDLVNHLGTGPGTPLAPLSLVLLRLLLVQLQNRIPADPAIRDRECTPLE